jgi:hypothetical protein
VSISDEAVEAAADVILRGMDAGHHAYKIAYAALEAAAPHLMAQAWYEGRWAGITDATGSANPYGAAK